ncbi:radical SAM additional 4Fe4S-binding SPASM domain-containing protein [Paenibacillus algorifonticola]|uniref:Radical SAM additional 4Fe4S-binding SPASM domain-containing protein n=1 Tax=Paenibacillus algorifonticola TaxID=684063 RepID=A0A1I2IBJ4_9BACL|nr:radical SAM protein [Paenibacillus algorifonticola]SFF39604.1 radical SAM additional 4Fe4S-binding SPASM domain-containing protein [Paenibacillus algorifonticola]
MQPKTNIQMDEKSFEILKRTIRNAAIPMRQKRENPKYKTELPEVVAIKLTNRCNLRCKHCYQWNEDGYHHQMDAAEQNLDIDVAIVERLFEDTKQAKSRLYLWGGEPMFHRRFGDILTMLEEDPREVTICSNGLLFDQYMEQMLRISEQLELLIAVEGFEKDHDLIRGKGSYNKVMKGIDQLLALRSEGRFHGRISVHCVINNANIYYLYDLMESFEQRGIDLVLLTFPWYIAQDTSLQMDDYFREHFDWLHHIEEGEKSSWHAFKYRIEPHHLPYLLEQLRKMNERVWHTRLRYQPGLEFDEIERFVTGEVMTSRCATDCLALATRIDVTPTGNISACKFFSEFTVGNLKEKSLMEIWNSAEYDRLRETINNGLTPACSKCNVLYLHGVSALKHI